MCLEGTLLHCGQLDWAADVASDIARSACTQKLPAALTRMPSRWHSAGKECPTGTCLNCGMHFPELAPDGCTLSCGEEADTGDTCELHLYEARTGSILWRAAFGRVIMTAAAFPPDVNRLTSSVAQHDTEHQHIQSVEHQEPLANSSC